MQTSMQDNLAAHRFSAIYQHGLEGAPIEAHAWLLVGLALVEAGQLDADVEEIEECLSDLEEHSDEFRYNDDHAVPLSHRTAAELLLREYPDCQTQALRYLDEWLMHDDTELVHDAEGEGRRVLREELSDLGDEVARFIESFPLRRVRHRMARIERLHELAAPAVIIDNEFVELTRAVELARAFVMGES